MAGTGAGECPLTLTLPDSGDNSQGVSNGDIESGHSRYAETAAAVTQVAHQRKDPKLTKARFAKALGTLLLLFVAAYGPAFLTVALLKLWPFEAVPAIIVIRLAVAILLIKVVSGRAGDFVQFGFRFCHYRYIAAAIVFGVPIAWALTILVNRLSLGSPPPEVSFRPWMTFLYFAVGAAIQDEIIFRGLLQTTLARQFPATLSFFSKPIEVP